MVMSEITPTDPAAIELGAIKEKVGQNKVDPKEMHVEFLRRSEVNYREVCINLIAVVEALRGQLIWGFYEEEAPEYAQGSEKLHELHELVTAEECNGLVKTIKALREQTRTTRGYFTVIQRKVREHSPSALISQTVDTLATEALAKLDEQYDKTPHKPAG